MSCRLPSYTALKVLSATYCTMLTTLAMLHRTALLLHLLFLLLLDLMQGGRCVMHMGLHTVGNVKLGQRPSVREY